MNNINLDALWNKIEESGLYDNQNDFEKVALDIKTSLIEGFKELESMEIDELLSKRYERFRKF